MGRGGKYIPQIQGYKAFIPSKLPPKPALKVSSSMAQKIDRAMELLGKVDAIASTLPDINLLISMYVKKEALLSAQIEGTQVSLEDVLSFEGGREPENIADVEEVVNYVKALKKGIHLLEELPLSLRLLCKVHELLMQGTRGAHKTPGKIRQTQNWLGPAGATLADARFVPPPPQEAKKALGELEVYMHKSTLHPLIDCALIHYQFETIHPFLDGNGRLGRLLITLYMFWKKIVSKPILYTSYFLKKNRQEYFDRLSLTREKGDYEQWVNFFLECIIETAQTTLADTKKILALKQPHEKMLARACVTRLTYQALEELFKQPIVQIKDMAQLLNTSFQTATKVLELLESLKIVQETTGQKRNRRYSYVAYLAILEKGTKPI